MSQTFCKHLRTKSLYTGSTVEEAFADKHGENMTPCHFWCNRTQTVVGVDDRCTKTPAAIPRARALRNNWFQDNEGTKGIELLERLRKNCSRQREVGCSLSAHPNPLPWPERCN